MDAHEKSILHRDFQSQNLMVKPDGTVHVIDYQGSRMGSVYYDLASLLLDPYVGLSDGEIDGLLRYFHEIQDDAPDFEAFRAGGAHDSHFNQAHDPVGKRRIHAPPPEQSAHSGKNDHRDKRKAAAPPWNRWPRHPRC